VSRLHEATSPYLLAHRDNPIDWFPWGPEAFEEARRRDVPVLISIGYHTCHWCHVMARECFSDETIAQEVNDLVVAIKVDREERPDVDSHYMLAAQAFTSHLGWPLNVFVTPDGHPFYAATYLPPAPRDGSPSFTDVVVAVSSAWREKRDEVQQSATSLTESLKVALGHRENQDEHTIDWEATVSSLLAAEDSEWGGFRGNQKFPMASVLSFLIEHNGPDSRALALRTLEVMAKSDLRDPIDGGFFRYATNRDWTVPHYERMLTDNALLLSCYATAGMVDIASDIVRFLRNQMAVEGGLASAQHSESDIDGQMVEGGYYEADPATRLSLTPPELDRKVITAWMGLVLIGLADAEQAGIPGDCGEWGKQLAEVLLARHRPQPGVLHRVSIDARVSLAPAALDDYGALALGLIRLGLATGDVGLVAEGKSLVDECAKAGDQKRLVAASTIDPIIGELSGGYSDISEGSMPSGEALISRAAHLLWVLTGEESYYNLARATASIGAPTIATHPLGAAAIASALWTMADAHHTIVVVDDNPDSSLVTSSAAVTSGRATVITVTREQAAAFADAGFEVFHGRAETSGLAYVCRGMVCDKPIADAATLAHTLSSLGLVASGKEN